MGKFKVWDQDNYEPGPGMLLDNEDIVDRDGYRTTEQIVAEMQSAGEMLNGMRRKEYEYNDDRDPIKDELDVTKQVGFDVTDAQAIAVELAPKMAKQVIDKIDAEKAKEKVNGPDDAGKPVVNS